MMSGRTAVAVGLMAIAIVVLLSSGGLYVPSLPTQHRSHYHRGGRKDRSSYVGGFVVDVESTGADFVFSNDTAGVANTSQVGGLAARRYANTTGPLMIYDDLPFPKHDDATFLVAIGIMSMDSPFGESRRMLIRGSWMTYSDVWLPANVRRQRSADAAPYNPSVLVKFVVGRHHQNDYVFTDALQKEARNTEHFGDIVAVSLFEKKSSSGKVNSTRYGIWGLESMLSTELKSFIWRRIAIASYTVSFVAKADDDIFLVVPNYVATLRVLPRVNISWGYHSLVERVPAYRDTTFPYAVGPIATASVDLARVMATSPIASFLSKPFTGRPADYFIRRCDHEDYGTYSSLDEVKTPFSVFHDCRFVEPYIHGKEFFRPPPLENGTVDHNAPPESPLRLQPQKFVNFHKLEPHLFQSAMRWFPETGEVSPPPTFTSAKVSGMPPRVKVLMSRDALANKCGPLTKVNYHTYWGELGPMRFQLTDNVHEYVKACSFQDLRNVSSPILLAMGILERNAVKRIRFRLQANGAPDLWSWWNRTHPVVLRFPIFFTGKGVTRQQFWECHRYQDMLSIPKSVVPFAARPSLHAFLWLRKARKLYPSAAFIGSMDGIPTEWNPFFLPSYLASVLNATRASVSMSNAFATKPEHILLHNFLSSERTSWRPNNVAMTIVSTSVAWTLPLEFPLASSSALVRKASTPIGKRKFKTHEFALLNALLYQNLHRNSTAARDAGTGHAPFIVSGCVCNAPLSGVAVTVPLHTQQDEEQRMFVVRERLPKREEIEHTCSIAPPPSPMPVRYLGGCMRPETEGGAVHPSECETCWL